MTALSMAKSIIYLLKCNKYLYFAKKILCVAILLMSAVCVFSAVNAERNVVLRLKEWVG